MNQLKEIAFVPTPYSVEELDPSVCIERDGKLIFSEFQKPISPWIWFVVLLVTTGFFGLIFIHLSSGNKAGSFLVCLLIVIGGARVVFNEGSHDQITVNPDRKTWRVDSYIGAKLTRTATYAANDVASTEVEEVMNDEGPNTFLPFIRTTDGYKLQLSWYALGTIDEADNLVALFRTKIGVV